eukprot:CAMPEP_0202491792 /NCGR_PEP_ID=MMETSP1361-20130828/8741_1 /ASSEMBLY_ACC=CAM_ASM_000849 /TAXON_ID=210615 /ORGANISM="Staurosira complex sp., Strain CCMP2646" /LENGTH=197 /DNA_ID=CAMNT_0049121901 /DNA_START=45 /DNA_END=638 /DNA_ORIENTATION=+
MTSSLFAARRTTTARGLFHARPSPMYTFRDINTLRFRFFSEIPGGANLLQDDTWERRPKIVLDAHASTGFDVSHTIQKVDQDLDAESGSVHMTSSILAFDRACFLWKSIHKAEDVTFESLSPVFVYRPKLKYLFIGCNTPIPNFGDIKSRLKRDANIMAEQLTIHNAMGTFNILNGEDRPVAAALVLEQSDEMESDE